MSSSDEEKQQRNREIAQNEAIRQTTGDIRVSGWAIAFAIILGVIAVGVVWAWLSR
jgi:Flp pilus assembly protein TadB